MLSSQVSILGYLILERLYNSSKTLVYRAVREKDRIPVVIKLLKNPYPSFNELVMFRNQYGIVKNLSSPGIIQTYSLEPYQNSYALVMEDWGGVSLQEYITNVSLQYTTLTPSYTQFIQEFLSIALQLVDILYDLYQHNVIHKDIKPANILINLETKQVKLIDFSIASLLPKETQEIKNPNVLEGTLAYISPEQTGRMNRGVDYRSDLYSLGVTFYELLTGKLPFLSEDPMELVHSHIAKQPNRISELISEIPQVLDRIVNKLMAKNAEERYQNILGLKYDLEKCLSQIKEVGRIEDFEIATRDWCDRFLIPEKLYGRETEVEELLFVFERVANGNSELMLVTGFSGIGKTAVVNEVHKPIVKQRGYFIKGKFDQLNRNIPLDAFVQAFRNLMGQLLGEDDTQLSRWKNKILQVLGDNAGVIIDVIPELEQIIGKQPPVAELSGTAAQNRFNLLFQNFIQVFKSKEHPLIIFLDDLQWADLASLKLMQLLIAESESGYLLLIGAYRDNEVFPAHPLMLTLEEIRKAEVAINKITLASLSPESLKQLVVDTLHCLPEIAQPLTQLVYQKTRGNPFFSTQFLKSLYEEGLIKFDFETSSWRCDISQIKSLALTDDVVKFMTLQLQKLPVGTQDLLKLGACIGNKFDLATLTIVREKSVSETAADLWKALQSGLILPESEVYKFFQNDDLTLEARKSQELAVNYRFLHDRVQQAAYSLISEDQKQTTHYHIGQLLLSKISKEAKEDRIFELVNQLNYGITLINQQTEREELALLNLQAARKARSATAYQVGREYIKIGLSLLGENPWQHQYEMSLDLHDLGAELAFLCGDLAGMERLIETVLKEAHSLLEQVNVYRIRIQSNASQNKLTEAIAVALQLLQYLGIKFPETPTQQDIQQAFIEIEQLMGNREIADLVHLHQMTDRKKIAIVQIIISIMPAAYMSGSPLYPLLVAFSVKLSIQYGNTSASAIAYATYGLLSCNLKQDVDSGVKFGQLALQVVSKLDAKAIKPDVCNIMGLFILHRKSHLKETLPLMQEGYEAALEVGNLEYTGYTASIFCFNSFWCGQLLATLEQQTRAYCNTLVQFNQLTAVNWCRVCWQSTLNLIGFAEDPSILSGQALQEADFLPLLLSCHDFLGLYFFYLHKLTLSYLFGDIESAQNHAVEVKRYLMAGAGTVGEAGFYFYDSLSTLAALSQGGEEKSEALLRVEQNQMQLKQYWADYAPMNFLHKFHLVESEKNRVLGEYWQAAELYDLSIKEAKENKFINEEALGNELAAKFYLDWGKEKIAASYMQEAYYCYAKWGAKAKIEELEQHYAHLLQRILQSKTQEINVLETLTNISSPNNYIHRSINRSSSNTSINQNLDFETLLEASQTISSIIELDELIKILTRMMLENSGANKCALLLCQNEVWQVRAIATLNRINLLSSPLENNLLVPKQLINYVRRTQEKVIIDKLKSNLPVICDYINQNQPQSILCLPILKQRKLVGILYLENSLTPQVFTSDRILILNFLCSQAAISLENAQLHAQEREKSYHLEQSQKRLQLLIERTPIAVFEWDTNFKFKSWNPAAEKMFGYQAEEVIGKHFSCIIPQEYHEYVDKVATEILAQRGGSHAINENLTKDGKRLICEWFNAPMINSDGELCGGVSMALDISDRKRSEAAIEQKSQELEQALQELQQAQLQIVQNEKMVSLGNLVAGVAHEVNNPIGFLNGSINNTKEYVRDLLTHLKLYQQHHPQAAESVQENAEDIDLEFLIEDLPKLLDSMTGATNRIKSISTSLRTFSRADTDHKVSANLHEGLDSTILILKYRLKANEHRPAIIVNKEYGEIPAIDCFLGQLNQVFMNILANAIDLFDEMAQNQTFAQLETNPQEITIRTEVSGNQVHICIRDNGKGMSEEVQAKIFDHLFTTKEVGKGTGLGLAIARQIIEETHGGKLTCNSKSGAGTEFVLELPLLSSPG
ncbi:MAG: AAA family ATPase [Cyanobacteria bacterium P01_A01_bin.84]